MNGLIIRGARAAAVAALVGATALGTAQATDWDRLQAKGWSGGAAGATAEGDAGAQTSEAGAGADRGAEIASAFQGLGMEAARAECYGGILTQQLSPDDQEAAAALVRTASSGDEVRSAVMNAGPNMVGGFSAADASCPEGMGG